MLHHLITEALHEDIGDGDHSTLSCIDKGTIGKAVLKIKQNGILAGVGVALKLAQLICDDPLEARLLFHELRIQPT